MDLVLEGMQEFSSAYVDDILIYSEDWERHMLHIGLVLARLAKAGLTAKIVKCEWAKSNLEYLGHRIGEGRIAIPEDRVTAIAMYVKAAALHAQTWELDKQVAALYLMLNWWLVQVGTLLI